jgi:hypothetical protein
LAVGGHGNVSRAGKFCGVVQAARGEDEETITGTDLQVEVRDHDIIVTMLSGGVSEAIQGSQLVARLDYFQHDQKGPITRAQFLARAWKLANDKARELGWIV